MLGNRLDFGVFMFEHQQRFVDNVDDLHQADQTDTKEEAGHSSKRH